MLERVNLRLSAFENRIGLIPFSLMMGWMVMGIAMLYVMPKFEAAFHGLQFSYLSNDPFNFEVHNPVRYRILPVLIGHVLHLRGERFFVVPLVFAWFFISSIYWGYRKKDFDPINAWLLSALIGFSSTLFIQLTAPGYTDAVFYFFMFWAFYFVRKPVWSAVFYGLALLSHESCLFMLPPLLLYSVYVNKGNNRRILQHAFSLVTAIVPLLLYRFWVSQHVAVEYDLDFYFSAKNLQFTWERVLPRLPVGLFFVFKLFWIIPIFVLLKAIGRKEYLFACVLISLLLCDLAQMLIAFDITRMLCLGFPILLLSAEKLKEHWPEKRWMMTLIVLVLLNFLIPQYFMTCDGLVRLPPFFLVG